MEFNPGFDIIPTVNPMGFKYGADVFGPQVENRYLRDIRGSLSDPQCDGPEIVYSIAMDVGKCKHREMLERMHLLYGVVTYAAGRLGKEPIRSQGHIHWHPADSVQFQCRHHKITDKTAAKHLYISLFGHPVRQPAGHHA